MYVITNLLLVLWHFMQVIFPFLLILLFFFSLVFVIRCGWLKANKRYKEN